VQGKPSHTLPALNRDLKQGGRLASGDDVAHCLLLHIAEKDERRSQEQELGLGNGDV
jgi:hypothetical protein